MAQREKIGTLSQALIKHYELLHQRYMQVPEWMLVYAVCPEHWFELRAEDTIRGNYYPPSQNDDCVDFMGFRLYLYYNAKDTPPICLFHSLEV